MVSPPPDEKIALYKALIDTHPEIEMKGKNLLYTSIGGHMYSMMTVEGQLGMRLSPEQQAAFRAQYGSGDFKNYNAVIHDYVAIPDDLLQNTKELAPYLKKSHEYTKSLPPKPTTKKKK
ncbi:MAG: hypothetical protein DWG76_00530 [Chloroflexi bacterium]|nr:hypothetical protein [Chloroflexota bacterium]MQC25923.1 hypothetical protein [Chloroflexota bacterium]